MIRNQSKTFTNHAKGGENEEINFMPMKIELHGHEILNGWAWKIISLTAVFHNIAGEAQLTIHKSRK